MHACYFAKVTWISNFCHGFSTPLDTLSQNEVSTLKGKKLRESSNQNVKNSKHNAVEKLVLLCLVIDFQASYICFSFYNSSDPKTKIKFVMLAISCFFFKSGGIKN